MPKRISEDAVIAGSPDEVWPLVTDPESLQIWYAFGGAEIDLRPGSATTLRWDEHGAFDAVVESVTRGKLFSFRWRPAPGPLVEIALKAVGNNTTRGAIVEPGELEDPEQRTR